MKSPKFLTPGLAVLLLAITLLNGCSGGPPPTSPTITDESEPNPSCTEADPLSLGISAHGWVQDKLDPIDFWTFYLPSDGTVDIHIYNDGPGDIDLGYNDSNYTWLGSSGLHGAGEDEFVNDIHLTAGTYFINVTADDDSGPYKPERLYRVLVTFTPDAQEAMQFAYSSDKDGDLDVYLTDTIGSFELKLTDDPADDVMCDFSPDGKIIYFNSDRDGDWDVYSLDIETMVVTNVTHDSETQYGCAVSENGIWIATQQDGPEDIYRLRSDGSMSPSEWINLTNTPGIYEHEMDWSPDGRKICYYRIDGSGNDIWQMDSLDGANQEKIYSGPGDDHGPTFHPDADHILYFTDVGSSTGLYYYSLSDGLNKMYYDTPASETGGKFSPDGNYVIFTVGEQGDIYYGSFPDMKPGEPIPVVTGPSQDSWAFWRPDAELDMIGYGHFVGCGCLQVDSTGNPCLFYSSEPDKTITYARFNGTTWDNITSDIKVITAEGLAIDSADTPHTVYGSEFGAGTNYAYYNGSNWIPTVVYSITWPGTDSSIALDSNGLPHFGIHGGGGGGQGVWHYWFDGVDWNSEHPVAGDQLIGPHIEIDQDDYPHIMTYYMYGSSDLWHIYKTESGWTTDNLGIGGNQPQAVFDSNWNLHCAYLTGAGGDAVNHIGYFVWDGASWSTPVVVDDSSDLRNVALALDSNNYPHISYIDYNTHFLKYAWYDGIDWQIKTVVDDVEASWRTSIVILPGDVPVIAYNDLTNGTVECVWVQ